MIIDPNNFLKPQEIESYNKILGAYGHGAEDFHLRVREDQSNIDLNDLAYKITITVEAAHLPTRKSKSYTCPQGSGVWLKQFEEDLKSEHFTS